MPTPKGREFIQRMLDGMTGYLERDTAEQIWINNELARRQVFQLCRNRQQCYRILEEVGARRVGSGPAAWLPSR